MPKNSRITSFQLDEDSERTLNTLARQHGIGKSALLRRMLRWQQFMLDTRLLQRRLRATLDKRNLKDEDDFERFVR